MIDELQEASQQHSDSTGSTANPSSAHLFSSLTHTTQWLQQHYKALPKSRRVKLTAPLVHPLIVLVSQPDTEHAEEADRCRARGAAMQALRDCGVPNTMLR